MVCKQIDRLCTHSLSKDGLLSVVEGHLQWTQASLKRVEIQQIGALLKQFLEYREKNKELPKKKVEVAVSPGLGATLCAQRIELDLSFPVGSKEDALSLRVDSLGADISRNPAKGSMSVKATLSTLSVML